MASRSKPDVGEEGSDKESSHLGVRLRRYRERRRLSVRALAERAGVSPSFVSQFERGVTNASVSSLRRLAEAVGVPMADLFEEASTVAPSVLRAEDRPRLTAPGGLSKFLVSRHPLENLEIYAGEFEPGATTGEPYSHGDAQEVFIVVRGQVVIDLDGVPHVLNAGDSIEYRSSVAHSMRNIGSTSAEAFWISSPPRFIDSP